MVFCGKCGLQLTSGNTVCPRCGTPIDPDVILEESGANNPTIASGSIYGANQPQTGTQGPVNQSIPAQQQPLVLGPDRSAYNEQMANQATDMVGSQAPGMPGQAPARTSYPGYAPQSAGNYPQQRASYPGYATQGDTYHQTMPGSYRNSPEEAARIRNRGRVIGLLLILLGLLLILGAMVLFLVTHNTTASAVSPLAGLATIALRVNTNLG